jgi:hypothetical protein
MYSQLLWTLTCYDGWSGIAWPGSFLPPAEALSKWELHLCAHCHNSRLQAVTLCNYCIELVLYHSRADFLFFITALSTLLRQRAAKCVLTATKSFKVSRCLQVPLLHKMSSVAT